MLDNHTAGRATTYCLCCRGGRDKEGETLTTITAGPGSQLPASLRSGVSAEPSRGSRWFGHVEAATVIYPRPT